MNARAFLVRGLLAGLLAGLATFFVAYLVGEPHVETAVEIEAARPAVDPATSGAAPDGEVPDLTHSHAVEESTEVARQDQRTWGLLTGTLAVGVALGGLVALVAAGVLGRIGSLMPGPSTALVGALGFVSVALVPFLRYPPMPPAVGSGDTIGDRTALYFGFLGISVAAALLGTYGAVRLRERIGTYGGVVAGAAAYLVVVVVAGQLLAPAEQVGDFPADTLWSFRLASLITLATMWGVLGVALTGLVLRLHAQHAAASQRRELVASL